jgi:hypothetical protein
VPPCADRETQRIVGGLKRERFVVDEPLLVAAAVGKPQQPSYGAQGLDPNWAYAWAKTWFCSATEA